MHHREMGGWLGPLDIDYSARNELEIARRSLLLLSVSSSYASSILLHPSSSTQPTGRTRRLPPGVGGVGGAGESPLQARNGASKGWRKGKGKDPSIPGGNVTLRQRDVSRNSLFADPFGDCCNQCFQGVSLPDHNPCPQGLKVLGPPIWC